MERADTPARRARREELVNDIFATVHIFPFELAQARLFAIHFAELAGRGEKIGERDLQIAATALSFDFEVATLNTREFQRVQGLKLLDVAKYVIA